MLRGDGLGLYPFGTPQADVISGLTAVLGVPGVDAGPPGLMATPSMNGCANRSQTAVMFPGLVVGFSDEGAGPVLTAWAASPSAPPLGTERGMTVGSSLESAQRIAAGSLVPVDASRDWTWWRHGSAPVAVLSADGGQVWLGGSPANLEFFSAGVGCHADPPVVQPQPQPPTLAGEVVTIDLSKPARPLDPVVLATYQRSRDAEGSPEVL